MTDWAAFPAIQLTRDIELTRVHSAAHHPAYFNDSDAWRFGPPASRKDKFGVCYLGFGQALTAYVEKYGRSGVITSAQKAGDALSVLHVARSQALADLTDRRIVGQFGVTNTHSSGAEYGPAQQLASDLFDAGFAGIRYRIRHDPKSVLEAVALFGAAGEHRDRFESPKTQSPIPGWLIDAGEEFGIHEIPPGFLP